MVIILGTSNPHSEDPANALWPAPVGCTGWRLWKMLHDRIDVSSGMYAYGFDRRNVETHGLDFKEGDVVLLLGEDVRKAVGLPKMLIHPIVRDGITFRQVPHPSGRNLFYNDPVQRELVAMLLEHLYKGGK